MVDASELQLNRNFARLATGDRSVLTTVFHGLWPSVHRFCRRYLGTDADADDAAQRALEKLFAQASEYDPSRSALAWALTLALFECRTLRRQSTRRRTNGFDVECARDEVSPEQELERAQLHAALDAALERLSRTDRETLEQVLASSENDEFTRDSRFRKRKERAITRLRKLWRNLYGT